MLKTSLHCWVLFLQDTDREVATFLNKKFTGLISTIETVPKEDLELVSKLVAIWR